MIGIGDVDDRYAASEAWCMVDCPDDTGWVCSLPPGHSGQHVAHSEIDQLPDGLEPGDELPDDYEVVGVVARIWGEWHEALEVEDGL